MILIAGKSGRLGNRLIAFSHYLACARENNLKVFNPGFDEYAYIFSATKDDIWCRYPLRTSVIQGEIARKCAVQFADLIERFVACLNSRVPSTRCFLESIRVEESQGFNMHSPRFVRAARHKLVTTRGWLVRDEENLKKHSAFLRDILRPNLEIEQRVNYEIKRIKEELQCDKLVGVHVRWGDYRTAWNGNYFVDKDEFIRLMRCMCEIMDNNKVGFIICSDEKQKKEDFSQFNSVIAPGEIELDLFLLSRCDYILSSESTYSAWASFYGEVPIYQIVVPPPYLKIEGFSPADSF